jgi:hypothetical protein
MKPMKHTYAIVLAGVLTTAPAALAQDRQTQHAVPRSEPAPAPPPAPQAAPSPPPARAEAPPSRGNDRSPAPERAVPRSTPPSRGDNGPATRATLRAPASESADGQGRPRTAHGGNGGSTGGGTSRAGGTTSRAVPRSQPRDGSRDAGDPGSVTASPRTRGDRQSYGVATARQHPPHPPHGGGYPWGDPWWWNSYPYSFGFFAWDPFWYGASYPVYGGYGYGGGYGYDAGYGYGSSGYGLYGGLKLKVKPRDAEVLVDGYFVGRVDDFDGLFQKLNLESGPHRIEIRAPGYETLSFDVRIEFDETVTYRGDLQAIQ